MMKPNSNHLNSSSNHNRNSPNSFFQQDEMIIKNIEVISILKHEKKKKILELLLHKEKTIMELSTETKWNPGTVKRHLIDLVLHKLVSPSHIIINEYHIKLKYYRATAKQYKFQYIWPTPKKNKDQKQF